MSQYFCQISLLGHHWQPISWHQANIFQFCKKDMIRHNQGMKMCEIMISFTKTPHAPLNIDQKWPSWYRNRCKSTTMVVTVTYVNQSEYYTIFFKFVVWKICSYKQASMKLTRISFWATIWVLRPQHWLLAIWIPSLRYKRKNGKIGLSVMSHTNTYK